MTLDVDLDRGLDMVGFPHLVAVPPRSLQEHIVRPAGEFTAAQASPVAAQDVASHSPLQRLAARRRRTATPGRLDQLPVHRGNVAPPERQPLPHLISHLETAPGPLIELTPGPGRLDPPPHSPLRDTQTLSRELHMPRRQPAFTIQPYQAPDRGLSGQPLIPPSRTLLTHARFPPSVTPPRDHEVIGDNGTYRANAPLTAQ